MIKIKKNGFTLSEMLITLSVVGLLGVLILPGLIKDTTSKASITLLQSTVSNINDAVQNEIIRTRATNLVNTYIFSDTEKFLKSLDTAEIFTTQKQKEYKTFNGSTKNINFGKNSAILKNGVYISIWPDKSTTYTITGVPNPIKNAMVSIYIDINGDKEPNIVGVDLFKLEMYNYNSLELGRHVGDIGGASYSENTKTLCEQGYPDACYYLLEASGFDHNYMKK